MRTLIRLDLRGNSIPDAPFSSLGVSGPPLMERSVPAGELRLRRDRITESMEPGEAGRPQPGCLQPRKGFTTPPAHPASTEPQTTERGPLGLPSASVLLFSSSSRVAQRSVEPRRQTSAYLRARLSALTLRAYEPEGRQTGAHGVSGGCSVAPRAPGRGERMRLSPRPGADRKCPVPHGLRRGLLSCAPAGLAAAFRACAARMWAMPGCPGIPANLSGGSTLRALMLRAFTLSVFALRALALRTFTLRALALRTFTLRALALRTFTLRAYEPEGRQRVAHGVSRVVFRIYRESPGTGRKRPIFTSATPNLRPHGLLRRGARQLRSASGGFSSRTRAVAPDAAGAWQNGNAGAVFRKLSV
jgi:hypothetical protein